MSYGWGSDDSPSTSSVGGHSYEAVREAYREPAPRPSRPAPSYESPGVSRASKPAASRPSRSAAEERRSAIVSKKARPGDTPPPIGKTVVTDSTHPIVVALDHTGSFGSWTQIVRDKLALFGNEAARYAPGYALSLCLIGDGMCDNYALQVRDFDSGETLDEHAAKLYPEGGGGDSEESYALAAYYYLNHCQINKAVKPVMIFILDAQDHGILYSEEVKKFIGDSVKDLKSDQIFAELAKKFTVYVVLKGSGNKSYWQDIFGEQRVVVMNEPRDVVEILIGIYAGEMGAMKDFDTRSKSRHSDKPDRVSRVSKALASVREASMAKSAMDADAGKSVSPGASKKSGLKSRSLLDE